MTFNMTDYYSSQKIKDAYAKILIRESFKEGSLDYEIMEDKFQKSYKKFKGALVLSGSISQVQLTEDGVKVTLPVKNLPHGIKDAMAEYSKIKYAATKAGWVLLNDEEDVEYQYEIASETNGGCITFTIEDYFYYLSPTHESAGGDKTVQDAEINSAFMRGVHSAAAEINEGIKNLLPYYTVQSFNAQSEEFKTTFENVMSLKKCVETLLELSNA